MIGPRIGSLFSGYGGLEQGVQSVLGGTVAWHSEIDPGACKILKHRYPGVPNLGDIERVGLDYSDEEWAGIKAAQKFHGAEYEMPTPDWSGVEPVDVLVGGFPCQDVSAAGKREGIKPGTRSGLWGRFADAIEQLRPSLVLIENVRGLLSADAHHPAHGDLEPCDWCVGDGHRRPLRALGAVLGDLSELGFDAEWTGLRAADVGAPHGRFRVFVVAWPAANADGFGLERSRRSRDGWSRSADRSIAAAHSDSHALRLEPVTLAGRGGATVAGHSGADAAAYPDHAADDGERARTELGRGGETAPHAESDGRDEGWTESARLVRRPDVALGGDDAVANTTGERWAGRLQSRTDVEQDGPEPAHTGAPGRTSIDWGGFGPAVERWERCLGRPAPAPTERGTKGQPRLSPAFVEFMMGLSAGWVTDVPGLGRNEQLKALGNGVVPQQAAQALRLLLGGAVGLVASSEAGLLPTPTVGNVMGGNANRSGARSSELLLPGVARAAAEGRLGSTDGEVA